jgi:phosphocarrier protein
VPVKIAKAVGAPIDARSILMVLTLAARFGGEVILSAEGDGADAALDGLVALLAGDLDAHAA